MSARREFDVLVAGAGPAGMAAACAAAEAGLRIGVVDDNPAPGGQIWRGEDNATLRMFRAARVELISAARVIDQPEGGTLLAEADDQAIELRFAKLVLATGARERFLPFPGWTLPNVMGAGGLQALVKSGLPIQGKRVVVAGTGPLLLAVAAYLRKRGAEVAMIAEQASWRRVAAFVMALSRYPGKLLQAAALARTPYKTGCWPMAAEGRDRVEAVLLRCGDRAIRQPCDYLACGFGLVPNLELPLLLGCAVRDGFVEVDPWQQTSIRQVYCAGEPTGIGGLDLAVAGGRIAGYAAAGRTGRARAWFAPRDRALRFRNALDRAFALRGELKTLPAPETIVCRCEDVRLARIREHESWRPAKLHTRCGMGPCQGRVCGPALEFLLGFRIDSVRPPIFPARLGSWESRFSPNRQDAKEVG